MSQTNHPADVRNLIYHIRGKAVMLDSDLAELYQVETRVLNQAVRRHQDRFPEDFMFQLTKEEFKNLISQSVTSSLHCGRRKKPLVFTEQGIAMLARTLDSKAAVDMHIRIMRAFVQIRRLNLTVMDLKRKINAMERCYDHNFKLIFKAVWKFIDPPDTKDSKIGFQARSPKYRYGYPYGADQ